MVTTTFCEDGTHEEIKASSTARARLARYMGTQRNPDGSPAFDYHTCNRCGSDLGVWPSREAMPAAAVQQ
jgi:hypothetical protein